VGLLNDRGTPPEQITWRDSRESTGTSNHTGRPAMPEKQEPTFKTWGVIELFGHTVIAGVITEQTIGGIAFIRVDVPETVPQSAFTKFYGAGAIYAITPTSEMTARVVIERLLVTPVNVYTLPAPQAHYTDDED
jgi:hypothetical protein